MTKQEVAERVLQNGKPLDLSKFEWDEDVLVFATIESDLSLDFSDFSNCTFKTGSGCTFKTGSGCTFDTGLGCTFDTGPDCTFDTGSDCTFKTSSNCTFKTGSHCTFDTGAHCTFKTGDQCVAVRRDVYEVIELPEGKTVKTNAYGVKGYKIIEPVDTIEINGAKYAKAEVEKRLAELQPVE